MEGLGIFSWFSYVLPMQERLRLIRQAGFDATSLWWGDEEEEKHTLPEMARKIGLELDNLHAPCKNPNDLWHEGSDGAEYLDVLRSCIADCRRHGIPTAVVHVTRLSVRPAVTALGIDRLKRLVDFAEQNEVNVALENLNSIPHLNAVYAAIPSARLGFCYDSGHEHCNHPQADCLSRYGSRLFAVHLHDNFGEDDTHLLPFDGTTTWQVQMEKLKTCRPIRFLTLEADFNRSHPKSALYQDLSAADFLSLACTRLRTLQVLS